MRKSYEMSQIQLDKLLSCMKQVPCIMIGSYTPKSQQENANDAWNRLGKVMGFNSLTVLPDNRGDRFFTAEPTAEKTD